MTSRRDTTLRAMSTYGELPARADGEGFRDYYQRAALHWLATFGDDDPPLRQRVETILHRDAKQRARRLARTDDVARRPEWSERRISLVGELARVEEIARSWEADAGWVIRAITPADSVAGHPSATVHVAVPSAPAASSSSAGSPPTGLADRTP